jgi:hypothetical protein
MWYELRRLKIDAVVIDEGSDVGARWFWSPNDGLRDRVSAVLTI